ncbi:hypothetical protein [Lactococcus phage PLG-II]|nr:hypothetical protein [Lactococcus phage PLG-II]
MYISENLERKIRKVKDFFVNISYKWWRLTHPKEAKEYDKQFDDFMERWFGND